MVVVALLQLVFYDNRVAVLILGEEVYAEVTGGLLPFDASQPKARGLDENVNVLFQPSGEVEGLVPPYLTQSHTLNPADHLSQLPALNPNSLIPTDPTESPPSAFPPFSGFSLGSAMIPIPLSLGRAAVPGFRLGHANYSRFATKSGVQLARSRLRGSQVTA